MGKAIQKPKKPPRCRHCGKLLRASQWARGKKLKSCPACSVEDGEEHVFLPFPRRFGTSVARLAGGAQKGAQSYCVEHRSKTAPGEGVRCSEVA